MMKTKDWQLLSEYLDNELRARDRADIEKRLSIDAELKDALESLQLTRLVLRSAPKAKAPRNFTLSPQVVGDRRPQPASYPRLRLAMVVASLLFVLVFTGDLTRLIPWAQPTAEEMAREAQSLPMAVPGMGGGGGFGGGGGGGVITVPVMPEAAVEKAAQVTPTPLPAEGEMAAADAAMEPATEEFAAPEAGKLMAEESGAYPAPEGLANNAAPPSGEELVVEQTPVEPEAPVNWGRVALRTIEVGLVLGTAALVGMYIYLMRRDW